MFYVLQNESTAALRRVPILLTDAATGTTAQSGIALTTIFPYVNINGGAFIGGTGSVAEAGFGQYYYEMDVNETATLGLAGIHVTAQSCRDYDAISQIAALNVYSSAGLGLTAGDVWNYDISAISTAGTAGSQLNLSALGGGSITAADVWDFDISSYNTPGNEAARKLYNVDYLASSYLDASISAVPSAVWTNSITGAFTVPEAGSYLYQLGTGATGFTPAGGAGLTAGDVWSYVSREITGGIADTVTSVTNDVNVSTASMAGVANTVWSTLTAPYTTHATFGHQVLRSDNSATIGEVTLHQSGGSKRVDADVQAFVNDTASATALKDILTGIGSSITANITGNLSGSVGSVTSDVAIASTSMTGIAGTVWTYASRTITGGLADTVTTLTDRSGFAITGGTITTVSDKTGYSLSGTQSFNLTGNITGSVSGSVGSVTGSVGSVVSAVSLSTATQASIGNSVWLTDITSFTAPSAGEDLATAAVGGISPADVWTYATRTITGGLADTVTTLTNRAGFAITGGTITTVSDKTGYSLSSLQTFDLTGNITGSVSGSVGSVSGAVGSVTGSVGSVAGNVVGSVASVTAPVSITTAAMGSIGSTVWNYVLSDTQTADANLVSAGSGGVAITVGDVWSYNTRTLTSGAGITVIGAVQLVNGPYRLTSNQNNSDGILDILQNSVQEINLNLIDGNGAPASTAGYASIVNIFDVAGTAVTNYTPIVEYADGGILTFELDTDVTATIGRYNLIVGLSGAGFNVKYGPLQILVRPL
jgi:hypothetical protein